MTMAFTSVLPKEWVDKVGKQIKRKPLGTGPFVIDSWTPGQEIVASKNPNYWDTGKPYLDAIKFDLTANPSTALLRLERGEVDVLGDGIPAADYQRTKVDPTWGKYVYDASVIATYYVFMNVREKPFTDVKVRQAVNYAIDTARIQKLLAGQAKALNQIYPEGMPGYQADKQFYTYDPEKAISYLDESVGPDKEKSVRDEIGRIKTFGVQLGVTEKSAPVLTAPGQAEMYLSMKTPTGTRTVFMKVAQRGDHWAVTYMEEVK